MKTYLNIFILIFILSGCQNSQNDTKIAVDVKSSQDTVRNVETNKGLSPGQSAEGNSSNQKVVALTSNALQLVDPSSGSTTEIPFGTPFDKLVAVLNTVLQSNVTGTDVNNECGAGPIKFANWDNGLSLAFQESTTKEWLFAGWYVDAPTANATPLSTMSGIGIGSTRAELEEVYSIEVSESTLGHEFSTDSELYGILSGTGKNATIEGLWSGVTCFFR